MNSTLNRRQLLQSLLVSSGTYALGAWAADTNSPGHPTSPPRSWPYLALDTERTAELAYQLHDRSFTGSFTKQFKLSEKTTDCLSCHGKDGVQADVMAKSCTGCHFPANNQHP